MIYSLFSGQEAGTYKRVSLLQNLKSQVTSLNKTTIGLSLSVTLI